MTEARVVEICTNNTLTDQEVWNLYVDKRIELRMTHGAEGAITEAIRLIGEQLNIQTVESTQLYTYLYRKNLEG